MIKNHDIICISSIDWNFIWQGHQEIMSRLAKNGNRILFVENTGVRPPALRDLSRIRNRIKNWFKGASGIRQEGENLFVCSPILLPFPYSKLALFINSRLFLGKLNKWIKMMDFEKPILWVFLPTPLTLKVVENIQSELLIYYCIDNFRVSSPAAQKIERSEIKLIKKADLIFVTSRELYNYCARFNQNVSLFPFAVNYEYFEAVRKSENPQCHALKDIPRPLIGYIGGIHKWIDLDLIKKTAEKMPDCSFVFVGPIQTDISLLNGIKNIYFLGKKEHLEIPYFIKEFKICVIPYLIREYTKNVYPTKLNEYLALGKYVISTALPEVIAFNQDNGNIVTITKNEPEFSDAIERELNQDENAQERDVQRRIQCAQTNGWSQRIEEMSVRIEDAITDRKRLYPDWKERFQKTLMHARKKIVKLSFVAVILWLALFYTSIVWVISDNLRISQAPQNADAIVVLGGGVGETGKASQGYEERVAYAVELYKKGFARQIVFSSGYMYHFKEPLIMKALAISLGVPDKDILLEDKATNTFENVVFTKKIIDAYQWKKILIVSSPYHMRRVALVMHKNAPGVDAVFTPVPNCIFYNHGFGENGQPTLKKLNFEQLNALIHEFLGILYYWFKGWI